MEMIEEVLKGLVARGLDGARVFATIFLRKVRILCALRGRMWDYEHGESQEELQDPSNSGLWRWFDGMIAGEGRRPIGGPSTFWSGVAPNLVIAHLVFYFLLFPDTPWFPSVSFSSAISRTWQAQIFSSPQQGAGRGCSPSRTAEEGRGEEEGKSSPCPGIREARKEGCQAHPQGDGPCGCS